MEFEFTWIDPKLVVSRTSGSASAEGFARLYEELVSQPEFGSGVKVLSNHTNLDASALSAGDVEKIANLRMNAGGETGMRLAVVVGSRAPLKFGLARMFGALADPQNDDSVRVFGTTDEALAWLRSPGSPFPRELRGEDAEVDIDPAT